MYHPSLHQMQQTSPRRKMMVEQRPETKEERSQQAKGTFLPKSSPDKSPSTPEIARSKQQIRRENYSSETITLDELSGRNGYVWNLDSQQVPERANRRWRKPPHSNTEGPRRKRSANRDHRQPRESSSVCSDILPPAGGRQQNPTSHLITSTLTHSQTHHKSQDNKSNAKSSVYPPIKLMAQMRSQISFFRSV